MPWRHSYAQNKMIAYQLPTCPRKSAESWFSKKSNASVYSETRYISVRQRKLKTRASFARRHRSKREASKCVCTCVYHAFCCSAKAHWITFSPSIKVPNLQLIWRARCQISHGGTRVSGLYSCRPRKIACPTEGALDHLPVLRARYSSL
jgi:hypothetical protein